MALFKKEPKPKKVKKEKPPKAPKVKKPHKRVSVLEIASLISLFAIVGTVGYLVYKNHFKKQVPETDKEIVNQLNASLEKRFPTGKAIDLTAAIDGIENDGIIFSRITLSDPDSELIFDSSKRSFGVFENGKGVTYPKEIIRSANKIDTSLWKFAKKNPSDKETPFSYYLLDGCSGKLTVVGGVDVGKNQDIERVAYINANDVKQDVIIKTNSYETELVVTETVGDNIQHYGRLGRLTVNRLHTDSYHEYGDCKYAYVTSGRVVAEKDGNIDVAYVVSQVAFLQEKDNGTIGKAYASTYRVRNSSATKDEKYGVKKPLEYDDNETQEENERIAVASGEAAQYTAVVEERIERGLENHPNAIGYAREGSVITIFDSYKEAIEHFPNKTIDDPGVVVVTGNGSLGDVLKISNTSIIFRGNENVMPQIMGNFEVSHTRGNNQIVFENISFVNTYSSKNNIVDYSYGGKNSLQFKNCGFSYDAGVSNKATIALAATNGVISTQLSVTNSKFSYGQNSQVSISTHALLNEESVENRGKKIISEQIHVIKNNSFKCGKNNLNPAIVSNYAEIKDNTFDGYDTALDLIPTLLTGNDCQFNITASGNSFRNGRYLFRLVDADYCMDSSNFVFNFDGSNSYSVMSHVANFEIATTNRYVEKTIDAWKAKYWGGITDKSIGVTLDSLVMDLLDQPYFDNFTLSNGDRITSFTQLNNLEPRTGYTLKALDENDVENTYYFYATFNKEVNILFKEDTNDAYVTLLSNGDVESLRVKELETDVDWLDESIFDDEAAYKALKYYDESERIGAIYKVDDIFATIGGNTFKNCEITQEEKYIKVSKLSEGTKPIELYISDIGEKQKLVLTNEENPFVTDTTALVISLPDDANVVLSGRYNVELKGTLENLTLKDRLHINLLDTSSVTNVVEISGENAENIDFRNYGSLDKVFVNSKGNITNYGAINYLCTGYVSNERYTEQVLEEASGASIENNGAIAHIETFAKANIFNFSAGRVENITINYVEGYEDLSSGSSITNNGTMCDVGGFIYIYSQCRFINLGIVGSESSTGYIVIGDQGASGAHDGTVITNAGIMWAGKDDEDNTRLFVIYGINENVGEVGPEIRINNTHTIRGVTTYDEAVYVESCDVSPILDISLNL